MDFRPLHDNIFVYNLHSEEYKTSSGIILMNDDGKNSGIHPRWCQVYAVGPKNKDGFKKNDWILVNHGRWTRGIDMHEIAPEEYSLGEIIIRKVDRNDIILKSEVPINPSEYIFEGK